MVFLTKRKVVDTKVKLSAKKDRHFRIAVPS
jgi:hypothetical protein